MIFKRFYKFNLNRTKFDTIELRYFYPLLILIESCWFYIINSVLAFMKAKPDNNWLEDDLFRAVSAKHTPQGVPVCQDKKKADHVCMSKTC